MCESGDFRLGYAQMRALLALLDAAQNVPDELLEFHLQLAMAITQDGLQDFGFERHTVHRPSPYLPTPADSRAGSQHPRDYGDLLPILEPDNSDDGDDDDDPRPSKRRRGAAAAKQKGKCNERNGKKYQKRKKARLPAPQEAQEMCKGLSAIAPNDVAEWARSVRSSLEPHEGSQPVADGSSDNTLSSIVRRCSLSESKGVAFDFWTMVNLIQLVMKCDR